MGGEGHINDMITRMKANRALLHKNDFYEKKNKLFLKRREHEHPEYHNATTEQLLKIRQEIKRENQKNFVRSTVILSFLIFSVGFAIWLIF